MGCRSDYMEPSKAEINSKDTAQRLVFVLTTVGKEFPKKYRSAACDLYGNPEILNEMVVRLCAEMRGLPENVVNDLLNHHKDQSGKLRAWWDKHEKADKERMFREELFRKVKRSLEFSNEEINFLFPQLSKCDICD